MIRVGYDRHMEDRLTALITGASSGIGLALARQFASQGYDVVLVSRNKEKLELIAQELQKEYNIFVKVLPKDLSIPTAPEEIYQEIERSKITVDALVNNAGIVTYQEFALTPWEGQQELLHINMHVATHLTHLFLPGMIARKQGKILFLASTAAFLPGPLMSTYYASKAYIYSFSQALRNEVSQHGILVSCLCPGPTHSNFAAQAKLQSSRLFSGSNILTAERVAEEGYKGLAVGKAVIIPGLRNKVYVFGMRFIPSWLAAKAARYAVGNR